MEQFRVTYGARSNTADEEDAETFVFLSVFALNPDQLWTRDGVKRTRNGRKSKMGSAAGSSGLSVLPQTDMGGQDRVTRWR